MKRPFKRSLIFFLISLVCTSLISCSDSSTQAVQISQAVPENFSETITEVNSPTLPAALETAEPVSEYPQALHLKPITIQNIMDIAPLIVLDDSYGIGSELSADGQKLANYSFLGVSIYDISSGKQTAYFRTQGKVLKTAFSADGSRLAALHELPNPKNIIVLRTEKSSVETYPIRYGVTVWDLAERRLLFSLESQEACGPKPSARLFQFSGNNSLFLDSQDFDTHEQSICRISAVDGSQLERLDLDPAHGFVRSLALSSTGEYLAAAFSAVSMGYVNPALSIFRFPDEEEIFKTPLNVLPNLAFVGHSDQLIYNQLTPENNYSLEIISPQGVPIRTLPIPAASVQAPFFSANENYISISYNSEVVVLDLASGEEKLHIPTAVTEKPSESFIMPDVGLGKTILLPESDFLLIRQDFSAEIRIFDLQEPAAPIFHLKGIPPLDVFGDLSPDGSLVASGGLWNGDVRVWSTSNGQIKLLLQGHQSLVTQVLFSPDGSTLASTSADGTTRLWNSQTGELLNVLSGHQGWVLREAFSADGSRLATSGADNTLRLWEITSGEELGTFLNPVPEGIINRLYFTAENTLLISIPNLGADCNGCRSAAFLLDLNTGQVNEKPWEHLAVSISPNKEWLLRYGSSDSSILSIGKMENGDFLSEKSFPLTTLNNSAEICLSADADLIFSFNQNGLNVLQRKDGEQITLAANHFGLQTSGEGILKASPDGRFLIDFTGSKLVMWGIPE